MMAVSASLQPQPFFNGTFLLSSSNLQFHRRSAAIFRWRFEREQDSNLVTSRTKSQAFRILANPNVCFNQGFLMYNSTIFGLNMVKGFVVKGDPGNDVPMVDPLEAKRLAAKQMEQIKAKEKFKRRCQIEAINGAWAMMGLTAGLVVEGQTGKSFLAQLAAYFSAIIHFFLR